VASPSPRSRVREAPARGRTRPGIRSRTGAFLVPMILVLALLRPAAARVYLDITSFDTLLPVAVSDFVSDPGIAAVVRSDLDFTHAFHVIDPAAYIESAGAPFAPENWRPLNAEAVLKGRVRLDRAGKRLIAQVSLYDPVENSLIFRNEYESELTLLRSLAHRISNDVYEALAGQESVFRTRIAYVVRDGGNKDIYIMDWDGARARRMTRARTLTMVPRWSRSGRYLAYASLRRGRWGIYALDLSKAKERLLFGSRTLALPGAFDPDGRSLYFAASRKGESKLYRIGLDGGGLEQLTRGFGLDVSPTVSPDGRRLAFVSDRGGSPQIYVMSARKGSRPRRLTFEGSYNTSPAWSPRGDRIAFVGRVEGRLQVFTITPEGEALSRLTTEGDNDSPSWSPDGRYLAYASRRHGRSRIYIMLANGRKKRVVSPPGQDAASPAWSPHFRF